MVRKYLFFIVTAFLLVSSCKNSEKETISETTTGFTDEKGHASVVQSKDSFETDEAASFVSQGIDLCQKGRFSEARELFFSALEIEPSNAAVLNNIGLAEFSLENNEIAADYFEKAIAADSGYYKTYGNYSLLLYNQGEYEKSIDIASIPIKYCSDNEILAADYLHSTLSLLELNACDKAKEYFEICSEMLKDVEMMQDQLRRLKMKVASCK